MKGLMAAALIAAGIAVSGCTGESLAGTEKCAILVSGNKVCGADAEAWCDTTDEFRAGDPALGIEPDTKSQAVCDDIRGQ
jgi:hypothetical protein